MCTFLPLWVRGFRPPPLPVLPLHRDPFSSILLKYMHLEAGVKNRSLSRDIHNTGGYAFGLCIAMLWQYKVDDPSAKSIFMDFMIMDACSRSSIVCLIFAA